MFNFILHVKPTLKSLHLICKVLKCHIVFFVHVDVGKSEIVSQNKIPLRKFFNMYVASKRLFFWLLLAGIIYIHVTIFDFQFFLWSLIYEIQNDFMWCNRSEHTKWIPCQPSQVSASTISNIQCQQIRLIVIEISWTNTAKYRVCLRREEHRLTFRHCFHPCMHCHGEKSGHWERNTALFRLCIVQKGENTKVIAEEYLMMNATWQNTAVICLDTEFCRDVGGES